MLTISECTIYIGKEFINIIAEGIEDWLWELNTYEYKDIYNDRADVAEELKNQLKDLKILEKVMSIYYNDLLNDEEKYNSLRKELKI